MGAIFQSFDALFQFQDLGHVGLVTHGGVLSGAAQTASQQDHDAGGGQQEYDAAEFQCKAKVCSLEEEQQKQRNGNVQSAKNDCEEGSAVGCGIHGKTSKCFIICIDYSI